MGATAVIIYTFHSFDPLLKGREAPTEPTPRSSHKHKAIQAQPKRVRFRSPREAKGSPFQIDADHTVAPCFRDQFAVSLPALEEMKVKE